MTLPFFEQQALYDTINKRAPIWPQAITPTESVVSKSIPVLRCPTDGEFGSSANRMISPITTYAGTEGYHWWPNAYIDQNWWAANPRYNVPGPVADYSGLFTIDKTNGFENVVDGTSNTIAIAETSAAGYKWGPIWTSGTGVPRVGRRRRFSMCVGGSWSRRHIHRIRQIPLAGRFGSDSRRLVPSRTSQLHAHVSFGVGPEFGMARRQLPSPGYPDVCSC